MADCHIDHGVGGLDAKGAWRAAWQYVAETKPDLAIVAGDLFHDGEPSAAALNYAGDGFSLAARSEVPVLLIAGNHEWIRVERETKKSLPIEVYSSYPNVRVIKTPKLVRVKEDLMIAAIPWISPQCGLADTLTAINGFAKQLSSFQGARLLAGHAFIKGGERGTELELIAAMGHEPLIPLSVIDQPAAFGHSVLGHIHNRQNLSQSCSYVGSTDRLTFADEGKPRGISDFTWNDNNKRWTETLVPVAQHKFRTYIIGVDDPPSSKEELDPNTQVRLQVPIGTLPADLKLFAKNVVAAGGSVRTTKWEKDPNEIAEDEALISESELPMLSVADAVVEWCRQEKLSAQETAGVIHEVTAKLSLSNQAQAEDNQ